MPKVPKVTLGTATGQPFQPTVSAGNATGQAINEWGSPTVLIDGFPIDATVTESHTFDSDVTDFPVEKGADITDHVRPKPLKISMEGLVSATPIGVVAQHATRKNGLLPVDNAYDKLIAIRDAGEPIPITTSLNTYKSMVMSSLDFPRESGEPFQLRFKATFVQVTIITNNRTTVRTSTPGGQAQQSVGQKLAKLGIPFASVFTLSSTFFTSTDTAFGEGVPVQFTPSETPILIDKKGRHYVIYNGSPPSDGFVIASNTAGITPGYHSWFEKLGVTFDAKAGSYKNAQGKNVVISPGGNPQTADQASKRLQRQVLNGGIAPGDENDNGFDTSQVNSAFGNS